MMGIAPLPKNIGVPKDSYNLAFPGSSCMSCGHRLSATDNIPILSYLLSMGRCRYCKSKISARYPVVEIVTAALSIILVKFLGLGWEVVAAGFFTYLSLAILIIDLEYTLIPNLLVYPLIIVGLTVNAFGVFTSPTDAVLGVVVGYSSFWLLARVAGAILRKPALGAGDFKLFAALGAWLGWTALPGTLFIASFVGSFVGMAMLYMRPSDADGRVPFAPFLATGGFIVLMFGDSLIAIYRNLIVNLAF